MSNVKLRIILEDVPGSSVLM